MINTHEADKETDEQRARKGEHKAHIRDQKDGGERSGEEVGEGQGEGGSGSKTGL